MGFLCLSLAIHCHVVIIRIFPSAWGCKKLARSNKQHLLSILISVQWSRLILDQDKNLSVSRLKKLTFSETQAVSVQSIPSVDETHI
jgi:hypothetical protein